MQVLRVSRIRSICQQALGNFPRDNSAPPKGRSSTFERDLLGAHDSNLPGTLTLNTPNFVCCWSKFPPLQKVTGAGAGRLHSWAILGHFVASTEQRGTVSAVAWPRGRVPRAPSKAGLRLLAETPKRKRCSSESAAHAAGIHGGKEKN